MSLDKQYRLIAQWLNKTTFLQKFSEGQELPSITEQKIFTSRAHEH
jgi:hypothetical protein